MIESENKKIKKREYWQDQIKQWQDSNLSQTTFCVQQGLSYLHLYIGEDYYWIEIKKI